MDSHWTVCHMHNTFTLTVHHREIYVHNTVKPLNKGHIGDGPFVPCERLCSSQRFCFKPIGIFLMTKITLKVFEMYYYNTFYFIFCFDMMVSPIANGKSNTTWIKKVEWCKINTWLLFVTALILQVQNTEVSVIHTRYNSTGMVIQAVECAMRSHFLATPLPYANKKGW